MTAQDKRRDDMLVGSSRRKEITKREEKEHQDRKMKQEIVSSHMSPLNDCDC